MTDLELSGRVLPALPGDRTCRIDWAAFDLEPPAAGACPHPAACLVVQGCPHEHIVKALACWHCLAYMRSLESLDRWGCAACLTGDSGHQCRAPVRVQMLNPVVMTTHAEYAFNPRQGAASIARYHAILDQPLRAGRFARETGDALCKPRRDFWGLSPGSTSRVSCPRCLGLAGRYGVTLPQED